jgi:phosphate transport system substrate-binding protein
MKMRSLAALFAVLALVLAACGGDDSTDTTGGEVTTTAAPDEPATTEEMTDSTGEGSADGMFGLPIVEPIDVDASVTLDIAGSSTVFPLSVAIETLWEDEGGPAYEIASIGSGGGLERFCVEGASDIANSSRAIDEEEFAACTETWGGEPIDIRVGTDALSVVISPGNTFATELTLEEVAAAFSAPAGATWADINPDFPAHPIAAYSPGADSGTFDYFNEIVFPEEFDAEEPSPILEAGLPVNIVGEDDNLTVQGVAEDGCVEGDTSTTCAIGYFGYAYYAENQDALVAVAVDGVAPSAESVDDNSYPISRPLYMYTSQAAIEAKPQIAEFIAFYLNKVNDVIGEVGYFPAPEDALQAAADHIKEAAGW